MWLGVPPTTKDLVWMAEGEGTLARSFPGSIPGCYCGLVH